MPILAPGDSVLVRLCTRLLALVVVPVVAADAQPAEGDGPISRSLLIRGNGLGVLLPLGDAAALQLSLGLNGSVSAGSGQFDSPPRSVVDASLSAAYMRFSPSEQRVRTFSFARLGYGRSWLNPDPNVASQTVTIAGGVGALGQVTPRLGLMADVGPSWTVRRQEGEVVSVIGTPLRYESTVTTWGLAGSVGVTIRAKPRTAPPE